LDITLTEVVIWLLIAALVGIIGELIARRRAPDGLLGAIILGFIAIFLIVGVFHVSISGEPFIYGVPLITSIIAAAILVAIWSAFAYHHYHRYASSYYYRRRPYSRRWRWRRR
jgi:uncharacterized membrane protein YeaQ/YmgE (transglycosylase-associated protein family)